MKLYLGIKFYEDSRNRELIEKITAVFHKRGHTTICITRDLEKWGATQFTPQTLMQKTFAIIETSAVAIIELSEKGVGLGIEAGYAFAKGIPIITIARTGSDISETLRGISKTVFFYESVDDLVKLPIKSCYE